MIGPKKVIVVTAYVPLPVSHLTGDQYKQLGEKLKRASEKHHIVSFEEDQLEQCWLHQVVPDILSYPPAAPVPGDRFATPEINVMSHVIQHNRTTWAVRAEQMHPDADVFVWADYGVIKQGGHTGRPVMEPCIEKFLDKVANTDFAGIPYPGIQRGAPIDPFGNNWRFCGSLHIWPKQYLRAIDTAYKCELLEFLSKHRKCPLDLAIWPAVEDNNKYLPFRFYQGEYDSTQFTGFPDA